MLDFLFYCFKLQAVYCTLCCRFHHLEHRLSTFGVLRLPFVLSRSCSKTKLDPLSRSLPKNYVVTTLYFVVFIPFFFRTGYRVPHGFPSHATIWKVVQTRKHWWGTLSKQCGYFVYRVLQQSDYQTLFLATLPARWEQQIWSSLL